VEFLDYFANDCDSLLVLCQYFESLVHQNKAFHSKLSLNIMTVFFSKLSLIKIIDTAIVIYNCLFFSVLCSVEQLFADAVDGFPRRPTVQIPRHNEDWHVTFGTVSQIYIIKRCIILVFLFVIRDIFTLAREGYSRSCRFKLTEYAQSYKFTGHPLVLNEGNNRLLFSCFPKCTYNFAVRIF
jgi:hypothetical protein